MGSIIESLDKNWIHQFLVSEFDSDGNLTKTEVYDKGELSQSTLYFELENKRVNKTEYFSESVKGISDIMCNTPDGRFDFEIKYKYDVQGNRIEEKHYTNCNTLQSKLVRKYNSKELLKETHLTYYLPSTVKLKTICKYDNNDNLIEETVEMYRIFSYSNYEFDAKGNWVKRDVKAIRIGSGYISSWVEKRNIIYY